MRLVRISEAPPADVLHVAEHMRAEDAREIYATRWDDSPESLANDCFLVGEFAWVAYDRHEPVAVIGATPCHPGVWSVFLFATDGFRHISIGLTRFVLRVMKPALVESGAHRVECRSIEGHDDAQRWLGILGFEREATLTRYGRGGETFYLYRCLRSES